MQIVLEPWASEPGRHRVWLGVPRPHVEYLTPAGSSVWTETPFPPPAPYPLVLSEGDTPSVFPGGMFFGTGGGTRWPTRQGQDNPVTSPAWKTPWSRHS